MLIFRIKYSSEFKNGLLKDILKIAKAEQKERSCGVLKYSLSVLLVLVLTSVLAFGVNPGKDLKKIILDTASASYVTDKIVYQEITINEFGNATNLVTDKIWYDPMVGNLFVESTDAEMKQSLSLNIQTSVAKEFYSSDGSVMSDFTYLVKSDEQLLSVYLDALKFDPTAIFKDPKTNLSIMKLLVNSGEVVQKEEVDSGLILIVGKASNWILAFDARTYELRNYKYKFCELDCADVPFAYEVNFSTPKLLDRAETMTVFLPSSYGVVLVDHVLLDINLMFNIVPPAYGLVTQTYSDEHKGIDITSIDSERNVYAALAGTVCEVDAESITICGDDDLRVVYRHLIPSSDSKLNDQVASGSLVGQMDEFVHFEILYRWKNLNPQMLLRDFKVEF